MYNMDNIRCTICLFVVESLPWQRQANKKGDKSLIRLVINFGYYSPVNPQGLSFLEELANSGAVNDISKDKTLYMRMYIKLTSQDWFETFHKMTFPSRKQR